MIPKRNGKLRRLGIPTARDRVVQASLKLVLEPIFEADFKPCTYGFRPKRRAQDAIAEIHHLGSPNRNYEWVFEADITACFDEIDHRGLMDRVRGRIGDKRVLGLVKAFLRPGFSPRPGSTGPRSPAPRKAESSRRCWPTSHCRCLDEHFTRKWEALGPSWTARQAPPRKVSRHYRLVRYADDFVVMVCGHPRGRRSALGRELGSVLAPMGLRLSAEKTRVCHIDEGFDFLGLAHPAALLARSARQAGGLHLPVQEGVGLGDREGADR